MNEKVIQVAKIPKKQPGGEDLLTLLATLCYFYPQYTLRQVRALPYKHVILLLKVAQRQEAIRYMNLTRIAAAPHDPKGKAVKNLVNQFERLTHE